LMTTSADVGTREPPAPPWVVWAFGACWALLAAGAWGLGRYLWDVWSAQPDYSHGFLLPPLAAWFAYESYDEFLATRRRSAGWGGRLAGASAAAFWAPGLLIQPFGPRPMLVFAAGVCLLAAAVGLLAAQHGWARTRLWLFPVFLLLLAIPIPTSVREPLQL